MNPFLTFIVWGFIVCEHQTQLSCPFQGPAVVLIVEFTVEITHQCFVQPAWSEEPVETFNSWIVNLVVGIVIWED